MNEIQAIFTPESIAPYDSDTNDLIFDLIAHIEYGDLHFQIISDYPKIIEFYERLRSIKSSLKIPFNIISINSIHKPLDEENMKKLLVQLDEKYIIKKETITPQLLELAESIAKDSKDFIVRFNGYAEPVELDLIHSGSNDLQVFIQQGQIEDAKKRMNQLIDKMEFIENTYVKKINIDQDKPLEDFNKQLNTIMNQNRLSRYQGLNKLSGGSSFDYFIYKTRSAVRSWFGWWWKNTHDLAEMAWKTFKNLTQVFVFGTLLALIVMFMYQRFVDKSITFNYILWWMVWLTVLVIHWVGEKTKLYIASTLFFIVIGYLLYILLKINFWL